MTLKPGKVGITFNKHGRITNMEEDAQPSILDTLKIPGWNITKIGRNKFSEKLFIDKSNGSEEYEITVTPQNTNFFTVCDKPIPRSAAGISSRSRSRNSRRAACI